jgi:hypothetical protein
MAGRNGNRRTGKDRRRQNMPIEFEDRRSGMDRRNGSERRTGQDRRSPEGMRSILNLGRRVSLGEVDIRR